MPYRFLLGSGLLSRLQTQGLQPCSFNSGGFVLRSLQARSSLTGRFLPGRFDALGFLARSRLSRGFPRRRFFLRLNLVCAFFFRLRLACRPLFRCQPRRLGIAAGLFLTLCFGSCFGQGSGLLGQHLLCCGLLFRFPQRGHPLRLQLALFRFFDRVDSGLFGGQFSSLFGGSFGSLSGGLLDGLFARLFSRACLGLFSGLFSGLCISLRVPFRNGWPCRR